MTCSRRTVLLGAAVAAIGLANANRAAVAAATIRMASTADGSDVWFDPVGLWLPQGSAVTWVNGADQSNTHTTTAYHPRNGRHSLRIPETAEPWDSGYLLPGADFTVTLREEGVYDYFCQPHELAGMVGRIVVGRPIGPGTRPFDWFSAGHPDWLAVPDAAQRQLPAIENILRNKVVRR